MISLSAFLYHLLANVQRVKKYENACDGTDGNCDCIGLIIGALRLAGVTWPWTHGSNYAARYRMTTLARIKDAADLAPGHLVYKARTPSDKAYDLPSRYKDHTDRNDYYHVGVVTQTEPLVITHCTGVEGGIKMDKSIGNWTHYGEMNLVDYTNGLEDCTMTELYKAKVTTSGGILNIRSAPSINATDLGDIPNGTILSVLEETSEDWCMVQWAGTYGYCMRTYLTPHTEVAGDNVTIILPRFAAADLLTALNAALGG